MDSFVFTRHSSDCKFKRDRFCNRCNCPKWVEGRFNHERFRKSASTRVWGEAEQFREKLEAVLSSGLPLDVSSPGLDHGTSSRLGGSTAIYGSRLRSDFAGTGRSPT